MKSLTAKLESEVLGQLVLTPGESFDQALPRFREFLRQQTEVLRELHEKEAGGLEVSRARATLVDEILKAILRALWPPGPRPEQVPMALLATGGYGRGELSPFSDIDFMFLEGGGILSSEQALPYGPLPGHFVRAVLDTGLTPGDRSVRTIDEAVRLANKDMLTKTSLLEARLVVGDEKLFHRFQTALQHRCVRGQEDDYIAARLEDQMVRRTKFGNSACMQEPNVKNGCGGLRDYHNLLWMTLVKYRAGTLAQLEEGDWIDADERRQLETAYDFLLRVRNELHYKADRGIDTLSPEWQPRVAEGLGYRNGSVRASTEKFMRDYYTHARNIHLITRTLEQRLALQPKSNSSLFARIGKAIPRPPLPFRRRAPVEFDGFKIQHGQLQLAHRRALRDHPVRLMRAFRIAQQRGLALHPDLAQTIRRVVASVVDHAFRSDPHVQTAFFEILNSVGNVGGTLRSMHEVGLLGAFLPEFGALTNLVQHEYFHRFATDEHTLVCIEKLDALQEAKELPFDRYVELLRRLERPWVLHLALLLHDVGKAFDSGNHSEAGGELVLKVARRLNLDGATTHTLRLIVEHHLMMPRLWQTRDLDDPEVIRNFCAAVQTQENLELLTLHTVADSLGTSEELWKDFHHNQHWTLYSKASAFFRDGIGGQVEAKERELLEDEVRRLLPRTLDPEEIRAHFEGLPPRYFHIHNAKEIARDLVLAHRFMHLQITEDDRALEPVVHWQDRRLPLSRNLPADDYEKDRGYAVVQVCTWDRAGLFSKITGALAAASLNIFGAQVFTRTDGVVLDTFYVADARTGELPTAESRQRFEKILLQVLTGDFALGPAIARTKRFRPPWQGLAGDSIATEIRFPDDATGSTVIEIVAEDRVGLLYAISHALTELDLNLRLAKIVTERGAAIDTFYVTELDGTQVTSEGRQRWIEQRLRGAIAALE